jgi:hypothetical protein
MNRITGGQIVEIGSVELALLAGVIPHVAFQYPIQKPLFTAVGGFAVIQSAGVATLLFLDKLQLLTVYRGPMYLLPCIALTLGRNIPGSQNHIQYFLSSLGDPG